MKVSLPKTGYAKKAPILPLVREETKKKISKENSLTLTLRVNPSSATGPTYQSVVPYLHGTESPREAIEAVRLIRQAWVGLNIDSEGSHANQKSLCERILKDGALDAFTTSVNKQLDEAHAAELAAHAAAGGGGAAPDRATVTTREQNVQALHDTVSSMVPYKALQQVKRYLRRDCRKPQDMKVRTFYVNLRRINNEEIPELPPFDPNQGLTDDEIVDILLYALPRSWVKEMDRQGFDAFDCTPLEIIDFMERIEATEEPAMTEVKKDKSTSSKKTTKKSGGDQSKTCKLHGVGHSTEECRTLKAKKARGNDSKNGGDKSSKDWRKKSNDSTGYSKKELKLLIAKQTKAELKSFAKKRKNEDKKDDSDDAASCNAFDMEAFSYKDVEKLNLDSKPTPGVAKAASAKQEPDSMDEFKLSDENDSDDDTVLTTIST